jgi:hypothetical protein
MLTTLHSLLSDLFFPSLISKPQQMNHHSSIKSQKLLVLLFVSVVFSAAFSYLLSNQPDVLVRSDHFSRWYATSKLVYEGRSLYDPQNGVEIVALNSIPVDPIEGSFFYPAYLVALILPIVWLPYPLAHFIWLTIIQIFLISAVWIIYKEGNWPDSINAFTLFIFLSILFIPNLQHTIWGQFNTIAVLSLALVISSLRREQYLLAGVFAAGMTFKPQQILLTLLYLLLWALFRRERWKFLLGFSLGMLPLLLIAFIFEPNWLPSFLGGIKAYGAFHNPNPALHLGNLPFSITFVLLLLASSWFFIKSLAGHPKSIAFTGTIILSIAIWWLAVPVLGMLHLVAFPIAVLMLFASLRQVGSKWYQYGLLAFVLLYILGFAGFIYGLSTPGSYGLHIALSELIYKRIAPIFLAFLALPLCLSPKNEMQI